MFIERMVFKKPNGAHFDYLIYNIGIVKNYWLALKKIKCKITQAMMYTYVYVT